MATAELLNASNGFGDWALALTGASAPPAVQSTSAMVVRERIVGERKLIGKRILD